MFYRFAKAVVTVIFHIIYRIEIIGERNLPKDTGLLICCNHKSYFDPVLLGICVDRRISFMAKESLFHVPILGFLIKHLGAFPVSRGTSDVSAIKNSIKAIRNNKVIAMFPEGTRVKTGKLGKIRSGVSLIATRSDALVIPVGIRGNYHLFSKMKVVIGKPVRPSQILDEVDRENAVHLFNAYIEKELKSLLGE